MTKREKSSEEPAGQAAGAPVHGRNHDREHPRIDALKDKAHEEKVVHGHVMSAADIFKFAGLVTFFVLMCGVCVLIWPYVHEIFEPGGLDRVMEKVQHAGPAGVAILLAIQFLQIVVAFIPGEVVQIAAGMLYGPWGGAAVVLVGCVFSSAFIFVLVHKLGAPFVQGMVPTKFLDKFRRFEASGKLNMVVFILFLIPGLPKDVFTYLVPLTDMRMRAFLLLSNIARIPGIVVSTYAAAGIVQGDYLQSAIIFAVAALVAVAGILGYNRIIKLLERRAVVPEGTGELDKLDPRDYESRK
ncbi:MULTISPECIES: TVP38/TMEM64 family protein [unclassified Adlercreutzia]|uniref:TVP38/TMEM64 family protein n=1 Tax=unclassified Adlercreutzia TaxID=2636013 RepID=UPI0013EDD7C8|nr:MULTISPECIES: VTT domain-containing protein [unclassified Adlercreutzia]